MKNQVLLVGKLGIFCIQYVLSKSKSNLIRFHYLKGLCNSFTANFFKKFVWKVKILSPRVYHLREMACFNLVSQRSKVQLLPPVGISMIFKMPVLTPKLSFIFSHVEHFTRTRSLIESISNKYLPIDYKYFLAISN